TRCAGVPADAFESRCRSATLAHAASERSQTNRKPRAECTHGLSAGSGPRHAAALLRESAGRNQGGERRNQERQLLLGHDRRLLVVRGGFRPIFRKKLSNWVLG